MPATAPLHVVVLGGGWGGVAAFKALAANLKKSTPSAIVTLVTSRSTFYNNLSSPRAVVQKDVPGQLLYPYTNLLKHDSQRLLIAQVDQVHEKHIVVSRSGESPEGWTSNVPSVSTGDNGTTTVGFDYAVIALGTSHWFPSKPNVAATTASVLERFTSLHAAVEKAQDVTILGAGVVGVELAAEIKTDMPHKRVTIIGSQITPGVSPQFQQSVTKVLVKKNIQIIGDTKVDLDKLSADVRSPQFPGYLAAASADTPIEIPLASGTHKTELVLFAAGTTPLTAPVRAGLGDRVLNERGLVRVNEFFQVDGLSNVFAVGDCCDTDNIKVSWVAGMEAGTAANNIAALAHVHGTDIPAKLKKRQAPPLAMITTIGRDAGASHVPGFGGLFGGLLPRWYKGDGGIGLGRKAMTA